MKTTFTTHPVYPDNPARDLNAWYEYIHRQNQQIKTTKIVKLKKVA